MPALGNRHASKNRLLRWGLGSAWGYFVLAALLGTLLRFFPVLPINATYKFVVHTHSHIALLGWVYLALSSLMVHLYVDKGQLLSSYRRVFFFSQFCLLGMLFSFPFQGYALFSIVFSTLFLFATYGFMWVFLKGVPEDKEELPSYICLKMALWYMVISSLGPWALGIIMNTLGPTSIWYRLSIYFYLHFQYNGWMLLGILGLFLYYMEKRSYQVPLNKFRYCLGVLNLGIWLTFFLSTLWTKPHTFLYVLAGIGGVAQVFAFGWLWRYFYRKRKYIGSGLTASQKRLLYWAVLFLGVKLTMQLLGSSPYVAKLSGTILDFTIGYLHWTFLGVVSVSLFWLLDGFGFFRMSKGQLVLYLATFLAMEGLLFYRGFAQWQLIPLPDFYTQMLAWVSLGLAFAVLGAAVKFWTRRGL